MKVALPALLALLLLTVESVVVRYLGFSMSHIDVTVAIVAFLALRAGTLEGSIAAFSIGYLLDLLSGRPTGLFTFLSVFTFLLGRLAASLVDVRTARGFALFAMGADLGHALTAIFFSWLTSRASMSASPFSSLPLTVLLTGVAALFLYPLLRKMDPGSERPRIGALR
jgi:rod shape-determining protein MreD